MIYLTNILFAYLPRFYQEVSTPVQGVCYSLKRFGGRWFSAYQVSICNLKSPTIDCGAKISQRIALLLLLILIFTSTLWRKELLAELSLQLVVSPFANFSFCRPLMGTSLSAWTPTPHETVSSTLLVSGEYEHE